MRNEITAVRFHYTHLYGRLPKSGYKRKKTQFRGENESSQKTNRSLRYKTYLKVIGLSVRIIRMVVFGQ